MPTRLIAISGVLNGAVFALDGEVLSIGREAANDVPVRDLALSRRHCAIKRENTEFVIQDLDSLNGTFVNGIPVTERRLANGDQIKLGDCVFLFVTGDEEVGPIATPVYLDEQRLAAQSTMQLDLQDALYLQPERSPGSLSSPTRAEHDLKALLKISAAINSVRNVESVQRQVLESLFEITPAARGAVLLMGENVEDFVSLFGQDRLGRTDEPVQVSRTIVRQVLKDGMALLSNDVAAEEGLAQAESLRASEIHSVLCAPLILLEKPLGAIYLDASDPAARFDENHLQLVTAVASLAAVAMDRARHLEQMEREVKGLREDLNLMHNMIGESARMRDVYQLIARVAPTDSTVLIRGESGTGKELVARAIHQSSRRADRPFVAINCAALAETLLESELFGHEKGAFTGAVAQKKGKLELAHGGTLFLDEIGDMAAALQVKLLRILQEREFERVGGTCPIKVNVRLLAATNKNLEEAIRNGEFRQDLYYRLNVVQLAMPPLRERRDDILLLANYFAAIHGDRCKRRVRGISAAARECLLRYDWFGNVRELENAIERAIALGVSDVILLEDLPEAIVETGEPTGAALPKYHDAIRAAKKTLIRNAIEQANGNYTEAAKQLGVHRNYLSRLTRNLDVRTPLKEKP